MFMRLNKSQNAIKEEGIELQDLSASSIKEKLTKKIEKAAEKLVPVAEAKQVYANALPACTEKYYHFIPLGRLFLLSATEVEPTEEEGYFVVTTNNKYIHFVYNANMSEYEMQIAKVEWKSASEECPLPVVVKILKKASKRIQVCDETLELQEL